MIIPMDIDEDGRIDILVQKDGQQTFSMGLIYNNMFYDSFFIKAIMVSQNQQDDQKFGSITTGATFRYIVTTLEDEKYIRVASQMPQSSYNSLELPYVYMGIGRSNNYLEQFNVAYSINNRLDQVKVFSPIIPNSQLLILANAESKNSWNLELFINPDKILVLIVLSISSVLLVSGIVIIIMHA